jgi:hypothetical protein
MRIPAPKVPDDWPGDIAKQAIGNALGTLVAALILFLGGVLLGAIQDVPTSTVLGAIGALVGTVLAGLWEARSAAARRKAHPPKSDSEKFNEIIDRLSALGVLVRDPREPKPRADATPPEDEGRE